MGREGIACCFLFAVLLLACTPQKDEKLLFCDMEELVQKNDTLFFKSKGGGLLSNGTTQSDEKSFSGKHSCKITHSNPWGISIKLDSLNLGDKYVITVWRHSSTSAGVLAVKSGGVFYLDTDKGIESKNGWELLELVVNINVLNEKRELLIHTWMPQKNDSAYFDDFTVKNISLKRLKPFIPDTASYVQLLIDKQGLDKLKAKRQEALKQQILITKKRDWTDALFIWGKDTLPVALRLKGDWTDHLHGVKWSFRIKIKGEKYWKGMKSFSLQSPEKRGFLHEWVWHNLLEQEDLLATRYDFTYLKLNDKPLGLYVYEEHFAKQLVEHQKRREGVILKFDEDEFWNVRLKNNLKDLPWLPVFESCEILPFSKNSVKNDSMANKHYEIGKT